MTGRARTVHYMVKKYDDTGLMVGRIEFDANEDAAAEAVVSRLEDGRSQELWCGNRRIASWPRSEGMGDGR